jgi:hypothetical protein
MLYIKQYLEGVMPRVIIKLFAEKGDHSAYLFREDFMDFLPSSGDFINIGLSIEEVSYVLHGLDGATPEIHCDMVSANDIRQAFETRNWEYSDFPISHILALLKISTG